MVRTVKSHQEEDEIDDEEFTSTTPYVSSQKVKLEGKNNNQKVNALRSKHSETEQRRRCKINERFQILRDLIPENDQKRDKASFLLEVIQYIQFLQERIQIYEGTYQGCSSESSKLMPWQRSNSGTVENLVDQAQFVKNGSSHEDNIAVASTLLSSSQNSIESDLSGAALYRRTDHSQVSGHQEIPLSIPMQPNLFEAVSAHPPQGSFSEPDHLASDSHPQFWSDKPCSSECAIPGYYPNHQEQLRSEDGEASFSSVYSQGLLNTLTHALQCSGMDLSQASISVQLDVGKRTNGHGTTTLIPKDTSSIQQMVSYCSTVGNYDHINKKLKTSKS